MFPRMGLQDVTREELEPSVNKSSPVWKWDFSPLSSWAQAQLVWKLEQTLFSSSCEGSPFPPGGVLELHRFLITKGKQAHPWCSEQREKSAARLQMLETQKWGDAPVVPIAVLAGDTV